MNSRATDPHRASWFIEPAAIMQIKNLTMRAKSIVEGFASGLHRSPLRGFSVEFAEYRPYVLGDDPRTVDWKLLARSDRYYVRQFEDETNRRCYIAVDQSRSMAYGSTGYSKAEYARTLAATLAYYLNSQRDAVGIFTCGVSQPEFLPPRHKTGHLQQIMHLLSKESVGQVSNLEVDLAQLASLTKRRGLVLLISDILVAPQPLQQPLGYLRGRGHEVVVLRVLDPLEVNLSLESSTMLRDMETGRELYVDPGAARSDYIRRFREHEAQLLEVCHSRGARLYTVRSDQPLDFALLELITQIASVSADQAGQPRTKSQASIPWFSRVSEGS